MSQPVCVCVCTIFSLIPSFSLLPRQQALQNTRIPTLKSHCNNQLGQSSSYRMLP